MELNINFIAILITVVATFFLGFLWYGPIFGKAWGKEMGYDVNEKPDKKVMMKGMLFSIIGNFFFAYVFSHNIAAWQFVPGITEMGMAPSILNSAVFTWLGFYFPGELGNIVWHKNSLKLFFINTIYHLVNLIVASIILTSMM